MGEDGGVGGKVNKLLAHSKSFQFKIKSDDRNKMHCAMVKEAIGSKSDFHLLKTSFLSFCGDFISFCFGCTGLN